MDSKDMVLVKSVNALLTARAHDSKELEGLNSDFKQAFADELTPEPEIAAPGDDENKQQDGEQQQEPASSEDQGHAEPSPEPVERIPGE